MNTQKIEDALRNEIAVILSKEPAEIPTDAPLHSLGIDSMSFVEILLFIERTFNLRLIETGLAKEDFETIGSMARCIEKELRGS